MKDQGLIIYGFTNEQGDYELITRRFILESSQDPRVEINVLTTIPSSEDFETERDNIIHDMAFMCEELGHHIHYAEQHGYKSSADSLRDCIKHLQDVFLDTNIETRQFHSALPRFLQTKNPRSGNYIKVDRSFGRIEIGDKKPFKGIKIIKAKGK